MPITQNHSWPRTNVDSFDVFFGFIPWFAGYVAFVVWARLIVRALRGEEAVQDWTTDIATAFFIGVGAVVSGARVRTAASLHTSVTETRELLKDAAGDAARRDQAAGKRDDRVYRVTLTMGWVAGLTLAAAIVTLAVTIVKG
jgi:hypothetical protein